MAQVITVGFTRVEWADDTRTRIVEALGRSGRQVWLTGNVRVDGGSGAGDHVLRRQLTASDLEDLRSSRITTMILPPFFQRVDAPGARQISVRFKVEISGGTSVELIGRPIAQSLPPPFHQSDTTTPAARAPSGTGGAPSSGAGTPAYLLRWDAHNTLVARRRRTTGPYPGARNLTTTVVSSTPPNCWQYNPVHNDTLVVGSTEYSAPILYPFLNWQGWNTAENTRGEGVFGSVFHQPKRPGGHTVCRGLSDIETIILHETAGWRMDNPRFMTGGWCNNTIGAQFNITSDGTIIQYYDVIQRVSHVGGRNADGVGIEFSNIVWTRLPPTRRLTPPRSASERTPRRIIGWWTGANYVVPPHAQLEALHELVQRLLTILPNVPANYRALDAHGEPHRPGDTRRLFLMSRWTHVYGAASLPGLYSHFNIRSHTDGSFQSLYLWLRTQANVRRYVGANPAERAYNAAIDLTDNHMVHHRCSDGTRRHFVDVTSVYPGAGPLAAGAP